MAHILHYEVNFLFIYCVNERNGKCKEEVIFSMMDAGNAIMVVDVIEFI